MSHPLAFLRQSSSTLPVRTSFAHDLPAASGDVALQYWPRRDGSSSAPSQLTFFILGNPGLLDYYIPFLDHLHHLLPPSHAILSTSHIGHTPGLRSQATPLDLAAQLDAKLELVSSLRTELDEWADSENASEKRPRLCLMGHSVGAWFVCELMKRLPESVHAGYLLFPTVGWIADSWNGRTLWPLFRRPAQILLPFLAPFLRPVLPFTTFPPTTLSLLRSSETIRHCLGLSQSEMEVIREPDLEWFRTQANGNGSDTPRGDESMDREAGKPGVYGVWSGGNLDGWVGREGPMVREALGGEAGGRVRVVEGVPHAFCLTQAHSELVAEVVAGWIVPGTSERTTRDTQEGQSSVVETTMPM